MTRRVRRALGDAASGVWLFGSAALGDYAAGHSDLDVQAVSADRLERAALEALAAALDHEALPCPARKLEFVLYARDDLCDPGGPAFQLNLNTGEGLAGHVAFDPEDDPRFWFVIDVAIGREHGVPLAGPPPAEMFPELPRPLIADSLAAALDWFESSGESAEQTVLAACRSWAWATDGRWRSKTDSSRWASARLRNTPGPDDAALVLGRARAALLASC